MAVGQYSSIPVVSVPPEASWQQLQGIWAQCGPSQIFCENPPGSSHGPVACWELEKMSAHASKTPEPDVHPRGSQAGAPRQEPHTLAELEASVHVPPDELITTQQVPEGLDEDLQWTIERRPFRLIGGA